MTRLAAADARWDVKPAGRFFSMAVLNDEVTIACESRHAPAGGETRRDFRLIEIEGAFALDSVGVVAAVAAPLAAANVSLFAFSVWSTDAILIQAEDLPRALQALTAAGHVLKAG